jgi:diaminopimelate decarboxylase
MEYDLARRVGVEPQRIIFNGPYKAPGDVELALIRGSTVNLDWPYQVAIVEQVARRFPNRRIAVGLRVTFALPSGRPSRFGFDADGGELGFVLGHLGELGNVQIAGLHCHFLTLKRSPEDYGFITERMLRLVREHFGDVPPRFINLGGGYFSRMKEELQSQFGIVVPTYAQYAEAIATRLAACYPHSDAPELILEPGIGLTADVVKFAAKVIDVRVHGVRKLALVSGSIYDIKPTLNSRNLPVEVALSGRPGARSIEGKLDIVGYTCMEHDVLFTGFEGTLAVGDYVVFDNVGAYTNVLRPPFIRECPAMLGWSSGADTFQVLKRREVLDDIFGTYAF